ncbi:MAG: amidase [Dehalococcoidia bacterium]
MNDIPLTITEAAAALRAGTITSVELTRELYFRANRLDSALGCYLYRTAEGAMAAAGEADSKFAAGIDLGPLQGIPIGVKDIIATDDAPTTANSVVTPEALSAAGDGPVMKRLRAAGAVIMGKVVTSEYACGMPDAAKPFPIPRNPWDVSRSPGGSSSGTGVGVAAGFFLGGLGTDTGGSIRIPAAWCGTSGIKPTFGRVPKSGVAPLGYSFDHLGPLARSARDCAAMLSVMAGYDASDPACAAVPVPDYMAAMTGSVSGLRIGVERKYHLGHPTTEAAVAAAYETAIATLERAGATVVEIELPHYAEISYATMIGFAGEAMAYHLPDLRTRWADYGRYTSISLAMAALLSAGDYVQIARLRSYARKMTAAKMAGLDVLLTPSAGAEAPPAEGLRPELMWDPGRGLFTPFWNAVGYPAMSIPMGFGANGLPLSLQVVAKPFDEAMAFRVGDAYQQLTDFHLAVPPIAA